jgi:hypothetical protein
MHMLKSRWLLDLCAVLAAGISGIYLVMYWTGPDGPIPFHERGGPLAWSGLTMLVNRLALAAGACSIAAGISAKGKSSLLILNGLALSAYGLAPRIWRSLGFLDVFAPLIVVMALSVGAVALAIAWRDRTNGWFFGLAATGSAGFALAFIALANGWIQLERRPFHSSIFIWLCLYFGFNAICMVGLGRRLDGLWEESSLLGNPKYVPRANTSNHTQTRLRSIPC